MTTTLDDLEGITIEQVENEIKLGLLKVVYIQRLREKMLEKSIVVEDDELSSPNTNLDQTIGKYTELVRKRVAKKLFGVEFDENGYPFIRTPKFNSPDHSPPDLSVLDEALSPVRGGYDSKLQSAVDFRRNLNSMFDAIKEKDDSAAAELEAELADAWREKYDEDSRFDEPWSFEVDNTDPEEDVVMGEPTGFDEGYPPPDEIADDSDVDIDVEPIQHSCSLGIKLRF